MYVRLPEIVACFLKNRRRIVLWAVLFGMLGAGFGWMTQSARSTAQLLYAPAAPLRDTGTEDAVEKILQIPIDMKSIGLLCTSDHTYQQTLDALNSSGMFRTPLDLSSLKQALKYEITISKETPYDLVYAPIIQLTATAAAPRQAQFMVNTWAQQCQEAGERYQEMFHKAAQERLDEQVQALLSKYQEDQAAYAEFKKNNILDLYESRITGLIDSINKLEVSRDITRQKKAEAAAQITSTETALTAEDERLSVKWKAPNEVVQQLLRTSVQPSVGSLDEVTNQNTVIEIEQLNANYMELRNKLAEAQINLSAEQARLDDVDELIQQRTSELRALQEQTVEASNTDSLLSYETSISGNAYSSMLARSEQAKVALTLSEIPLLQVFAEGAEWPVSPITRPLLFGGAMAILTALALGLGLCIHQFYLSPLLPAPEPQITKSSDVSYV